MQVGDEPGDGGGRLAAGRPAESDHPAESASLDALPASVLLRLLAGRIAAGAKNLFSQQNPGARSRDVSPSFAALIAKAGSAARAAAASLHPSRISFMTGLRRRRRVALLAAIALLPAAYLIYCIATIPFAGAGAAQSSPGAMVVDDAHDNLLATRGIIKGERIAPDRIPPTLAAAVTSIEDRRFYQHDGIDLRATARAAWHDLTGRHIQGGSTISQQLARRLYLTPDRTLKRKVQEAALAVWLEFRLSKKEILARYLDTAYFGDGAYGIDAAARHYFGKTAQQLTLSESAMLAGLIKAPSELAPDRNPAGAQQRADVVLAAMADNGAITQQQADAARQEPAVLHIPAEASPGSNYFIDTAANEVKARIGPTDADVTVRTTLDPQMQQLAERVVASRLAAAGKTQNVHQAALVALAPDGAILALVGGRDYGESQFNRATQARRQPGSLFKLFVYLTALRRGYTADSVMVDQPVSIGDWEPDNYGDHYYGPVTLRSAFAHSLNSVAVQLAQSVGIANVIATAKQSGVRSDLPAVPSVALGSGEVSLIDMTRAFANVAENTAAIEPYSVREIVKNDHSVYARAAPPAAPGIDSPAVHGQMVDLLSGVVRDGTGRAARLDRPVGGKTGTSEDYHDAWFVGFTSDLIVGVWVGNDDNSPMNGVTGGSLPAGIWHDFVSAAETGRPQQVAASNIFRDTSTASLSGPNVQRQQWLPGPFRFFGFHF